jgi:hypothetical protein
MKNLKTQLAAALLTGIEGTDGNGPNGNTSVYEDVIGYVEA